MARVRAHRACLLLLLTGTAACAGDPVSTADGGMRDSSAAVGVSGTDGGPPVFAQLTFVGCSTLSFSAGQPVCAGRAPLALTFVPLAATGVDTWQWSIPGGDPAASPEPSPRVRFSSPGVYVVTLVVAGATGSATASGRVLVGPARTGGACSDDGQCAAGYVCVCGGHADGGAPCPAALTQGLCSRGCEGAPCGPDEVCADLSRSTAGDPKLADVQWRRPLCLPACADTSECPSGLVCRAHMALLAGAKAGGAFLWRTGCFAAVLGDLGAPCVDTMGHPSPSSCLTGQCAPFGARGICTASCATGVCPPDAACATFTGDAQHPVCVPRCDPKHPCADPLLDCQVANATGELGFAVPSTEPSDATYCAPRRCSKPMECAPAGSCDAPDAGAGFCHSS